MTDSVVPATVGPWDIGRPPVISYVPWTQLWDRFEHQVADLVRSSGAVAVGELGGGANPTMALAAGVGRPVDLTVLDISAAELERSPSGVDTLCVDLCAATPPVRERFDLVFSRMLCEHVSSGKAFHRNCHAALRPGGHAVHFFPAVTAVPFALNRVLPAPLSQGLLERMFPSRRSEGRHAKFPAEYHWCWGPTAPQLARYRSLGFQVLSYDVGIGHGYYQRIPVVRALEAVKERVVLRHPSPWLAAFAIVVLRRAPASPGRHDC